MELEKFERQLRLLEMLVGNTYLTVEQLCERTGLTKRSIYRYLDFFKTAGFDLMKNDGVYSIELSSPFITRISDKVRFTGTELEVLRRLLEQADKSNAAVQNLKIKLGSAYGMQLLADVKMDKQQATNINSLYEAINQKRKVVLHNYYSPHSNTVSDRLVEPFKFVHNGNEVRCFDIKAQQCKTFKVSRIQKHVEVLNEKWEHTKQHITYYTDIFGFSGEKQYRVKLRMGRLSMRILMEEYGVEEHQFVILDDSHWLFSTFVCNYQGVGRFVMGLIKDIDIIESPNFEEYLREDLNILTKKIANKSF
jgi:predicted DNA-binding transcriptional regulator YafY